MENNTEIKSYAGFTIGPIYDLMSSARKTRELWFASYFFSWFMENLACELSKNNEVEFITPFVENPFKESKSLIGKYHDRFILYSYYLDKDDLFNKIETATNNIINFFFDLIDNLVKQNATYLDNSDKSKVKEILSWYVQRNFVVFDKGAFEGSSNIANEINCYLDSMEENRTFKTGINSKTCFVCKTLPAVITAPIWVKDPSTGKENPKEKELCPLCYLKYFALESNEVLEKIGKSTSFKFPSIFEIAAVDVIEKINPQEIEELTQNGKDLNYEEIEDLIPGDLKEFFKHNSYFKYIAILQADGDNLGKTIDSLGDLTQVKELSKTLFDFSKEAENLINSYKGYPIYIGGDDILALLPVAFNNRDGNFKTVLGLAKELSESYDTIVKAKYSDTTLSIGINISYYKFPLSIALKSARSQLSDVAKKVEGKNTLAILLTKHSGHQLGFKYKFGSNEIQIFSELLSKTLGDEIDFPHSMHHNLSRFKELISYIPDENRLDAFFKNNFNEPIHNKTKYKEGIKEVKNYFRDVMLTVPEADRIYCVKDILQKLAFIKFLRREE